MAKDWTEGPLPGAIGDAGDSEQESPRDTGEAILLVLVRQANALDSIADNLKSLIKQTDVTSLFGTFREDR